MTLITCIVISTKTLDAIMNDKVNYRLSMLEGNGLNIVQWVADFQGIGFHFLFVSVYFRILIRSEQRGICLLLFC